ncbi:hypothetical protein N0V84_000477 [Fusarium piperis]|uniref:Uncharacterized protein n=1 Tax=Fusarium piperis TaxID=1435070 RepID=A0A9W8WMY3_9HYPO|nr:hypothetical protein N0V84_000477 [Fusarium piperis]
MPQTNLFRKANNPSPEERRLRAQLRAQIERETTRTSTPEILSLEHLLDFENRGFIPAYPEKYAHTSLVAPRLLGLLRQTAWEASQMSLGVFWGLEGEAQKCLSEQDPKCITRCRHTQLMDSWLTGCEQMSSTNFMTPTDPMRATFNDQAGLINARLEEIDLKHTKTLETHAEQLKSQADKLSEHDALVATHGNEVFAAMVDNDNINCSMIRFERRIEQQFATMDRVDDYANQLAEIKTELAETKTELAETKVELAELRATVLSLMCNETVQKLGDMSV